MTAQLKSFDKRRIVLYVVRDVRSGHHCEFFEVAVLKLIEYKSGPMSNTACNALKEVALSHGDLD